MCIRDRNNNYSLDPDFSALFYKESQGDSPEIIFAHHYYDGVRTHSAGLW